MNRPALRTATAFAAAAVAFAGAACTSAQGPDPTQETTEPVPVEPNQEPEAGLNETPAGDVDTGTDG